jgi:hypothetical protein
MRWPVIYATLHPASFLHSTRLLNTTDDDIAACDGVVAAQFPSAGLLADAFSLGGDGESHDGKEGEDVHFGFCGCVSRCGEELCGVADKWMVVWLVCR